MRCEGDLDSCLLVFLDGLETIGIMSHTKIDQNFLKNKNKGMVEAIERNE
jgi:hypothetical protein